MKKLNELKIYCAGDSITKANGDTLAMGGWVGRLQQAFPALPPHFFNYGIAGETLMYIYDRIKSECLPRNADIILLSAGTNDLFSRDQFRNPVFVDNTKRDWEQKVIPLIEQLKSKNIEFIIINITYSNMQLTITNDDDETADEDDANKHILALEKFEAYKHYNNYLFKLSKEHNIPLIDITNCFDPDIIESCFQPDGVHLTTLGYDIMSKKIYEDLVKILSNYGYEV